MPDCAQVGLPLPVFVLSGYDAFLGFLLIAAAVLMIQVYIDTHPALFETSAALMAEGAHGMVYGRNIYQHPSPRAVVAALRVVRRLQQPLRQLTHRAMATG